MKRSLCIVTVHGIGFQQPPSSDRQGYADPLHARLRTHLDKRLGDDPERKEGGPVYVSSEVDGSRQQGLSRLARDRPLAEDGKIAHVAVVYSPSEPLAPWPGAVADVLARALLAHNHYVGVLGGLRLVLGDAWAALHERDAAADSTLTPRSDLDPYPHRRRLAALLHGRQAPPPAEQPGPLGVLRALEDDMATYVARNDLRERVRSFVQEVLLRLASRPDVGGLALNAHSQGTVICWDVLCRLPFFAWREAGAPQASLFRALVTAGSPIRKYVDLFAWGEQVGQMVAVLDELRWRNFYDGHDPVADPLNPAAAWKPGRPLDERPPGDEGLLIATDPATGVHEHVEIEDVEVDNVAHSAGGGLQAHDYWSNDSQFVRPLAEMLTGLAERSPPAC